MRKANKRIKLIYVIVVCIEFIKNIKSIINELKLNDIFIKIKNLVAAFFLIILKLVFI